MIKRFAVVLAVGLAVAVAAFFPISKSTRAQEKPTGDVQAGKAVYKDNCQKCHGDVGQGNPRMYKLVNAKIVHLGSKEAQQKTDDSIRKSMTDGFGKMEKVEGLTPDQINNTLAFCRSLALEPPQAQEKPRSDVVPEKPKPDVVPVKPKGDAEVGKALYKDNCQKCHAAGGEGVPRMYRLVKATIVHLGSKTAQEKSDEQFRKTMTDGFGKMEPTPELTTENIDNIVAFVRTLKQEPPK